MRQTPRQHRNQPLGFGSNPTQNQRIGNPFLIYSLHCAKTVQIDIFRGKKRFSLSAPFKSLKINRRRQMGTQENPKNPKKPQVKPKEPKPGGLTQFGLKFWRLQPMRKHRARSARHE